MAEKLCQTAVFELPSASEAAMLPLTVLVIWSVTGDSSLTLCGLNQLASVATSVFTVYSSSGNLTACPGTYAHDMIAMTMKKTPRPVSTDQTTRRMDPPGDWLSALAA